jgi:hypothetical protein
VHEETYSLDFLDNYSKQYQYYYYTKNKNILKHNRVDYKNLKVVMEDAKDNIVTYAFIRGFDIVEKTDINEEIVDLEKEKIFVPYKN